MNNDSTHTYFPYASAFTNQKVAITISQADSIGIVSNKPKLTTSIFVKHQLQNQNDLNLINKFESASSWLFIYLLITLLITSLISQFYRKRFSIVLNAPWQNRYYNQINNESKLFDNPLNFMLFILYAANLAFFIVMAILNFRNDILQNWNIFGVFSIFTLLIMGYTFIKTLAAKFTSILFKQSEFSTIYGAQLHLSQNNVGVYLLPFLWILMYHPIPYSYRLIAFLLIAFGVFRLIKTLLSITYSTRLSMYQIFLYLCTVEILPLIVVIKFVYNNI